MEQPRSIKELLQVLLDNQDLFVFGLCQWNKTCWNNGLIIYKEFLMIREYININRPDNEYTRLIGFNSGYYWFPGDLEIRIRWLNEHIAKLKQEGK